MNTPDPPIHQTLRTLSRIATITGTAFLIISLTLNFIPAKTVSATSGSIWTTRSTCIPPAPQDENHYTWGEEVYIRGSNFDPNTDYYWGITGQPGGASADPGIIVAAWYIAPGTVITTDADGYFCFKAYTIAPDDLGEYNVDVFEVGGTHAKSDNYQVDPAPTATLPTPPRTPLPKLRRTLRPTRRPVLRRTPRPIPPPTRRPLLRRIPRPTRRPVHRRIPQLRRQPIRRSRRRTSQPLLQPIRRPILQRIPQLSPRPIHPPTRRPVPRRTPQRPHRPALNLRRLPSRRTQL